MFTELELYLSRIPAIKIGIETGTENKAWWIKFAIDISHDLAWNVVQELGHVINSFSSTEKLPIKFYPVSPPPYNNGGPKDCLSWIIESSDPEFSPELLKKFMEGRLPSPVNDKEQWIIK